MGFGNFGRSGEADKAESAAAPPVADESAPAKPRAPANRRKEPAGEKKRAAEREAKDLKSMLGQSESLAEAAVDLDRRSGARQFYRVLEKTQEWVENNYYHLPLGQRNADLITANPFWTDYAAYNGEGPFYSEHFAETSRNFPEMMFALSVLDLPFQSPKHETEFAEAKMNLKAGGSMIVLHEEIEPAKAVVAGSPILVNENFFRHDDRYRYENGERLDKFITDEFIIHTVYGCQVVVTNPTSSKQKLDLLLQIPQGAIPVLSGQDTRSVHIELEPFHTSTLEYNFYFPAAGDFAHYPVQVCAERGNRRPRQPADHARRQRAEPNRSPIVAFPVPIRHRCRGPGIPPRSQPGADRPREDRLPHEGQSLLPTGDRSLVHPACL